MADPVVATYSIVACDLDAGQWGVAVQSKFLAVGSVVPWAEPHVGAVATQAYANPRYGPEGLDAAARGALGAGGRRAADRSGRGTRAPSARGRRRQGRSRDVHGQAECFDWAGGRTGRGLRGAGQHPRLGARRSTRWPRPSRRRAAGLLAERLDRLPRRSPGGRRRQPRPAVRRRCSSSSATAATHGLSDVVVDLRVDDHELPIEELRRIYVLHDEIFGKTPRDEWLDVDETLAERAARAAGDARLRGRARRSALPLGREGEPRGARRRHRADRSRRPGSLEEQNREREGVRSRAHRRPRPVPRRRRGARSGARCGADSGSPPSARTRTRPRRATSASSRSTSRRTGTRSCTSSTSGRATFTLGDEEIDAPAGTFVYASPGTKRGAVATEPKTTVLAIGAKPGVPHEISGWEGVFVAFGHLRNGDEDAGRKAMADAIASEPDAWQGYYNAACFESLSEEQGRHVRAPRAGDRARPEGARVAQGDEDFDWLRDDPEFPT